MLTKFMVWTTLMIMKVEMNLLNYYANFGDDDAIIDTRRNFR